MIYVKNIQQLILLVLWHNEPWVCDKLKPKLKQIKKRIFI